MEKINVSLTPIKLKGQMYKLKDKYPEKRPLTIDNRYKRYNLEEILQKIEEEKNKGTDMKKIAEKLSQRDREALARAYLYILNETNLHHEVSIILLETFDKRIGELFWNHYQSYPKNEQIIFFVRKAMGETSRNFLMIKWSIRNMYHIAFSKKQPEHIIQIIAEHIKREQTDFFQGFSKWRIAKNSNLECEILIYLLRENLKIIDLEEEGMLSKVMKLLDGISVKNLLQIMERYLEELSIKEWNTRLITFLKRKLKKEDYSIFSTDIFSQSVVNKIKKYFIVCGLDRLFSDEDDGRREYWEKYTDYMDLDLTVFRKLSQSNVEVAIMYFEKIIVVEFQEINHACYIYQREGFHQYLERFKGQLVDKLLKNKNEASYISSFNHRESWQNRFDDLIIRKYVYTKEE